MMKRLLLALTLLLAFSSPALAQQVVAGRTDAGRIQTLRVDENGSVNAIVTPVTTSAVASNLVVCAAACNVYGFNVTVGASAGYVLLINATSAPADGAVTPIWCIPVAANSGIDVSWRQAPRKMTTGATLIFSTTGCFTKTASATAFMTGDAKAN